jgi:endonuclease YncB( thermonuclease family)
MATRDAISNFIITVVVLFFMVLLAMLLKGRYRLPSEAQSATVVPKAVPVAAAVDVTNIPVARAYKSGEFWVLPKPQLVVSRGNEPDTLRIRSGEKEDVFVLYFVDAVEASWIHPKRVNEQATAFGHAPTQKVLETGSLALGFVTQLLRTHKFTVYTKWGRVPESERFYAFIMVETSSGKQEDLGEMLVRKGYALPSGQITSSVPIPGRSVDVHLKELRAGFAQAKADRNGLWSQAAQE